MVIGERGHLVAVECLLWELIKPNALKIHVLIQVSGDIKIKKNESVSVIISTR